MSEVKVNKISPRSGTTVTLGDSGDTITLASGVSLTGVNATFSGDLTVDTNTLYVDSTNNRVGIGHTNPAGDLHIEGTNVEVFLSGTGNSKLQLKAGTSSNSFIEFGDTDDGNVGRLLYAHVNNSMQFNVNASEAMRISSNQNIGIKNSIPDTFNQFANALVVGSGSGNSGITLYSGTANDGNLNFADGTSGNSLYSGFLTYDHSEDAMKFFVNYAGSTSPRMTIDSSGNVLVGTTTLFPTGGNNVEGITFQSSYESHFSRSGGAAIQVNRKTNDGDLVGFKKDGVSVGSIGTISGTLRVSNDDVGVLFNGAGVTPEIVPAKADGSASDNLINLGNSGTRRFKNLYLGGNIYLGGTGSANALDDYEEGTWTPVDDSGAGLTFASVVAPTYTKIGRMVIVNVELTFPTTSDTSRVSVGGFPFNVASTSAQGGFIRYSNQSDRPHVLANPSNARMVLYSQAGGLFSNNQLSGKRFDFTVIYNT